MSYKKFATSLLFACMSSTCLIPNAAQAGEPELYFYPKNKWQVERVNPESEMLALCTVSNQLNNGYIVELSGTEKGFSAINIDFRQNVFQNNLKYEVQFSLPGLTRAIVPSRASGGNKIVSDISAKSDLVENLGSAGVLDVQIRDNNFRVYLTGLKASMTQFNDCISPPEVLAESEGQGLIQITETEELLAEELAQEIVVHEAPIEQAAIEIVPPPEDIFIPAVKPVEGVLAPPPPVRSALSDLPELSEEIKDPSKLRPEPSDKPRYTQQLAEQLKAESDKFKPEASPVPRVKPQPPAEKLVETTDESNAAPKTSNITRETAHSPDPVYTITRNEKPIVADFTDIPANKSAQNASKINPSSGQAQKAVINDDFVDMRNKISSMETELIALRKKNKLLDEELSLTLKDSEKERISVSSDNWNLERATMKFNESERQIARLGRQLQTARAMCEQEKTELETMLFDPKLTDQSQLTKLATLETELESAQSDLYRMQRQYEERINLLEQQLKGQ